MLFGQFNHSLDDKNRLMIPSRIKSELASETSLYVLRGFEGCISIYTKKHFEKLIAKLEEYSFLDSKARDLYRATLSSVTLLNIDKIGRIQFTPAVLEKYSISKEVTVIGVGDHFEVWDRNSFEKYEKEKLSKFEELADTLVKKDD